jgi:uncharacterized iron-regulated membrane protein
MTFKQLIKKLHLWLGFVSGIIVAFLGITGCMLAFQHEIEQVTNPYQFVEIQEKPLLPPSKLQEIAVQALPEKHIHGIAYREPGKAIVATFYSEEYYYLVYLNPYSGEVLKVKDMSRDFFRIIVNGHFYLWLPPAIGQPIVASATLFFVILLITGIILWWPRKGRFTKQTFSIKWANSERSNLDLHRVLGFYASWILIFITFTGLVWGFQWFARSTYWLASGGKQLTEFYMPTVDSIPAQKAETPAVDVLWERMSKEYPSVKMLEVHIPENDSSAIEVAANPDDQTYWKADYRYFDQYTLEEIEVTHLYGKLSNTTVADKIARMNYDIHVGAIAGLAGKILAFCASIIAASLPVTGFLIWRSRRKKQQKPLFQ